jgi:hypothetical protein
MEEMEAASYLDEQEKAVRFCPNLNQFQGRYQRKRKTLVRGGVSI